MTSLSTLFKQAVAFGEESARSKAEACIHSDFPFERTAFQLGMYSENKRLAPLLALAADVIGACENADNKYSIDSGAILDALSALRKALEK